MAKPFLSIIIPAHNEEERLPGTLEEIHNFIDEQDYSSEIIVVENGSEDRTLEIALKFESQIPRLKVLHEDNRGKGLAVKRGMLEASGDYRFFLDVDLSMPITELNRFVPPELENAEIAIGSREAPGAVRYNEPEYRHIVGRIFNSFVRLMALPDLHDTQCGFKCFRGDIAEELFTQQTMDGMSFDVEVLYIAKKRGYKIFEIPIPWYFNPDSRVKLIKDSVHMWLDLIRIRSNDKHGLYDFIHQD